MVNWDEPGYADDVSIVVFSGRYCEENQIPASSPATLRKSSNGKHSCMSNLRVIYWLVMQWRIGYGYTAYLCFRKLRALFL